MCCVIGIVTLAQTGHMPFSMRCLHISYVVLTICCINYALGTSEISHEEQPEERRPFRGNIWAVLAAGSNGYYNYRHQADICHAYQVLKSHGIPDERIIVMMYDDIAHNRKNPTPGVIINHPKGKDVYQGVPKDYVGKEVS